MKLKPVDQGLGSGRFDSHGVEGEKCIHTVDTRSLQQQRVMPMMRMANQPY